MSKKTTTTSPIIPPMPKPTNLDPKKKRNVGEKTTLTKRRYLSRTENNPFGKTFKQTDDNMTLKRERGNLFEMITCVMCDKTPTQYRCTMEKGEK